MLNLKPKSTRRKTDVLLLLIVDVRRLSLVRWSLGSFFVTWVASVRSVALHPHSSDERASVGWYFHVHFIYTIILYYNRLEMRLSDGCTFLQARFL